MQRSRSADLEKILKIFYLLLLFVFAYLLLLPLGGYRSYRPYIIRRDTLQPVLWVLFFTWGLSTVYILKHARLKSRLIYTLFVIVLCAGYTLKDELPSYNNVCERQSLAIIAASKEDCVELTESCTVMQWGNTTQCEETRYCAELLHLWNITPKITHYKHKP